MADIKADARAGAAGRERTDRIRETCGRAARVDGDYIAVVTAERFAETKGRQRLVAASRGAFARQPRRAWPAPSARDRPRNDDEVTDAHSPYVVADCRHLGHAFVSIGKGAGEGIGACMAE